ncbi:hypothetical protein ACIBRY_32125 [Streptomyces anulatus]
MAELDARIEARFRRPQDAKVIVTLTEGEKVPVTAAGGLVAGTGHRP